jgi:Flp pilus assembly protein TadB
MKKRFHGSMAQARSARQGRTAEGAELVVSVRQDAARFTRMIGSAGAMAASRHDYYRGLKARLGPRPCVALTVALVLVLVLVLAGAGVEMSLVVLLLVAVTVPFLVPKRWRRPLLSIQGDELVVRPSFALGVARGGTVVPSGVQRVVRGRGQYRFDLHGGDSVHVDLAVFDPQDREKIASAIEQAYGPLITDQS